MNVKLGVAVSILALLFTGRMYGQTPSADEARPPGLTNEEYAQWQEITAKDSCCEHILAVDADGNALLPRVTFDPASQRFSAKPVKLLGEDTRGAKFDAGVVDALSRDGSDYPHADSATRNLLRGRKLLYLYLDRIFKAVERDQPDEVVVHIHGGLNTLHGAIEKTALISRDLRNRDHGKKIFYIGICWNSDLFLTYQEHLFFVREGLRQPGKAIVTTPAMLLADLGGAASRLPLNLINFLYQDAYTVNPSGFKRTQLAQTRTEQILWRQKLAGPGHGVTISPAKDDRTELVKLGNVGSWALTQPSKVFLTYFLDWLGTEPWKNMLRRTRTLFERESQFIPEIDYRTAETLAPVVSAQTRRPIGADALLDQMNATGRQGAVSLFCSMAQARLLGAKKRPAITLIGHSMGAIVSCEILERFHQLALDNVVFMGAACSISDFKAKVIPYLQEQNLRESLRGGPARGLDTEVAQALSDEGVSPEIIARIQRRFGTREASPAVVKTRFYNLCLHDTAENGEKAMGKIDLIQRGSLLNWIDLLYQKPESENDRTFGRWVNAILSTDNLPADVAGRITIKEFGQNRQPPDSFDYAYKRDTAHENKYLQEPMHHGDFGRFAPGADKETTNLAYWREIFWRSEERNTTAAAHPSGVPKPAATAPSSRSRRGRQRAPAVVVAPSPAPTVPPRESQGERDRRTGF